MIRYFALDPEMFDSYDRFRRFVDLCAQIDSGQVIADFPEKEWCKRVVATVKSKAGFRPVEFSRVVERLKNMKRGVISRPGFVNSVEDADWCEAALAEHKRKPFERLVSVRAAVVIKGQDPSVVDPSDIDPDVTTPKNSRLISRSPGALWEALFPLLEISHEIHLVDRFISFEPHGLYIKGFKQFTRRLAAVPSRKARKIVFHWSPKADLFNPKVIAHLEKQFTSALKDECPDGFRLTLNIWRPLEAPASGDHPLHNRYVLTNRAGVQVGYGLGSTAGESNADDTISFLSYEEYQKRLARFQNRPGESWAAERIAEVELSGR